MISDVDGRKDPLSFIQRPERLSMEHLKRTLRQASETIRLDHSPSPPANAALNNSIVGHNGREKEDDRPSPSMALGIGSSGPEEPMAAALIPKPERRAANSLAGRAPLASAY